MKACKHLDYDQANYPTCELQSLPPPDEHIQFWLRPAPYEGAATRVQFCGQGRGRINSILDCYEYPGPCHCYEAND